MYKAKLQELCHQKRWALPRYSTMKDGPSHDSRFKSSVVVNGNSFHSSVSCRSSKASQDDAAKLAFLHFTSPPPPTPPNSSMDEILDEELEINEIQGLGVDPDSSGSSTSSADLITAGTEIEETSQGPEIHSEASTDKNAVQYGYKTLLYSYVQRKNLDSPLYSSVREGPAHAPRFKATITVGGRIFESPTFFTNLKEAEHAASKVALMSLASDGSQEDDCGFYKSLLQQLSQKEGLSTPLYLTIKSGASHMPMFFSTVEVEGEVFHGQAGRYKKEAEVKAAKVAYTVLIERAHIRSTGSTSCTVEADGTPKITLSSDLVVTVNSQNLKQECQLVSSPATKHAENIKEELQEVNSAEMVPTNAKARSDGSIPSPVIPCIDEMTREQEALSYFHVPASPKGASSSSPPMTLPDVSALSISESSVGSVVGTDSYLLNNRVRVYSCFPDIAFPEGITVLPISDNKWVAVSLEFPNEVVK